MGKGNSMFQRIAAAIVFLLIGSGGLYGNTNAHAASAMDMFVDPSDGQFDAGNWLLEHKGFLPVPVIVTEPAVGYGAGLGVLFFHESLEEKIARLQKEAEQESAGEKLGRLAPPSISGVMGMKTENGTWALGGFHFGSWKKDSIRYTGGLAKVSINIKYYGRTEDSPLKNGVEYNMEGVGILQEVMFRVADSDVFIGGRATYFDAKSKFDLSQIPTDVDSWELDFRNLGVGLVFEYDSRDNIFTPNRGTNTEFAFMFYNGRGLLSTTREYQISDLTNRSYWEALPGLILGWRLEANLSTGSVPFYALPYINLRGIPVNRYQGSHVLQTELEARYQITDRWSVVPFAGIGATTDSLSDLGNSEGKVAGGIGFRYLIARALRLQSGVDVARGPEDWAIYFTVGSGL
jgi:hypothetical protein